MGPLFQFVQIFYEGEIVMKIITFILIALCTGCSLVITKPEVSVKSITLTGVDRKGVDMEFLLTVKNPNSYRINLTGYRYDLLVAEALLAHGESHDEIEFNSNTSTDFPLTVRFAFRDIFKIIKNNHELDKLPYRLKAGLDTRTPVGQFTIPVDRQGLLALPRNMLLDRLLMQLK